MKKFMKTCAIIALVMIVAGIALGIVASTRAGRSTISQVVEAATGGRVRLEFDEGWGFFGRLELGDMEVGIPGLGVDYMESYDIGDASMFSKNHEILSGDVEMYSLGSEIRNMEVQVGGCHFETKFSKDDAIYVETKNVRKFQGYVEGDTLYVLATTGAGVSWSNKKSTVILYLPQDYEFDQVEIDMGAGELEFDRLNAKEASLEVGAGRILLGSAKAQELKAEVGAGQIEFKDMAVGKLDDTGYPIPTLVMEEKSCLDIISTAIQKTLLATGKLYTFFDDAGALSLREAGAMVAQGDGSLLLDYSYKTDIDEHTANCVKLARPNESTGRADVFQVMDGANIARWGLLQLYQTIDEALNDAQAAAQAQAMLAYYNRRWRTLKVSALGLPGLKAGQMLMMDVPALGDISLFGLVLLEKVTHTFEHDTHTMDFEVQELGVD